MIEGSLADVESIKVLMARYFRFLDTKQWESLRAILTDDMSMAAPDDVEGSQPLAGADRVVRLMKRVLGPSVSVHRGYCPEIEILNHSEAKAIWAMDDTVTFTDDPRLNFRGSGHYDATYTRTADGWKISSLTLRRVRLDRS